MKDWSCLNDNMAAYCQEVRKLEDKFDSLELSHVLRHNNEAANQLANFGSRREATPTDVFVEHLHQPTIAKKEVSEEDTTRQVSMVDTVDAESVPPM